MKTNNNKEQLNYENSEESEDNSADKNLKNDFQDLLSTEDCFDNLDEE